MIISPLRGYTSKRYQNFNYPTCYSHISFKHMHYSVKFDHSLKNKIKEQKTPLTVVISKQYKIKAHTDKCVFVSHYKLLSCVCVFMAGKAQTNPASVL